MNYLPEIHEAEAGTIELVTAIVFPNGKFLRDAVKMDASSVLSIAEHLEE